MTEGYGKGVRRVRERKIQGRRERAEGVGTGGEVGAYLAGELLDVLLLAGTGRAGGAAVGSTVGAQRRGWMREGRGWGEGVVVLVGRRVREGRGCWGDV